MKLSPLVMETWSFESIHCLNLNTHHQKRHDVINDLKFSFLICGFFGCMSNIPFLANIVFFISLACNGIHRKVDTDSFLPKVCMI